MEGGAETESLMRGFSATVILQNYSLLEDVSVSAEHQQVHQQSISIMEGVIFEDGSKKRLTLTYCRKALGIDARSCSSPSV